ncbi:hypothetical protein ISP17_11410 [Dyella ginsengisoli]|uniref:DUF7210 domain-containing protein n=1 Tax=Dyella ginsengisoli TaxID=363848 RepID=A0ABW8JU67_9GAMM
MILDRAITLLKSHTHAGVVHAIGAELHVLAHDAEWLVERGIAMFTSHAPADTTTNNPAPSSEGQPDAGEPAAGAEPEPAPTDPEPMNPGDDHE